MRDLLLKADGVDLLINGPNRLPFIGPRVPTISAQNKKPNLLENEVGDGLFQVLVRDAPLVIVNFPRDRVELANFFEVLFQDFFFVRNPRRQSDWF